MVSSTPQRFDDRELKVETGGDATTRDPIPVDTDAIVTRLDAENFQWFIESPMRGRTIAVQQPSIARIAEPVQTEVT